MKKRSANMYFVANGLYDWIKDIEDVIDLDISRFSYIVDGSYIDVIGDSGDNDKYDGEVLCRVELREDKSFDLTDLGVIYRGDIEVISTYPEYTVDSNNCIVVDKESLTNESYVNALRLMTKEAEEYKLKKHSNYGTRIIAELINEELIVLKLIYVKDFFYCYDFEYYGTYEKILDVAKFLKGREKASYEGLDFYSMISYVDGIDAKCKISYKKYGQAEETVEIDDTFVKAEEFWDIIHGIRSEVKKYNLEMGSLDKFGMDIYKMDELAGYFAMEYMFQYDLERLKKYRKSEHRISSDRGSFYDILHRQNTTMGYCETLQSFLENMPLDKIVQGYKELENNPEKDLLDIFHTVFNGRYRRRYIDESDGNPADINFDEYYIDEEPYKAHLYAEGQAYLALIYQERVDEKENINDAYVVLLSEREQYRKGMEMLKRRYMPRFMFEDDIEVGLNAYRHLRKGEQCDTTFAIMKNNTYEQDGKKYMHVWSGEVVVVQVVGKHENGMLLTELYEYI